MPDDFIYVWPDGSWCYGEDLEACLTFKSDDYQTTIVRDDETQEEAAARVARST